MKQILYPFTLGLIFLISPVQAESQVLACDSPESVSNDYSVAIQLRHASDLCTIEAARAHTRLYAYNRFAADVAADLVRSWSSKINAQNSFYFGFSENHLSRSVTRLPSDNIEEIGYYFSIEVDLNGDGELCNGDLSTDFSQHQPVFYFSSEKNPNPIIPVKTMDNRPCLSTAQALQPRDLDGDLSTVEAYYDTQQGLTWLADANLATSQAFGLSRGDPASGGFSFQITSNGLMDSETTTEYLKAMNSNEWLLSSLSRDQFGFGYVGWRLPDTKHGDTACSEYNADTPWFDVAEGSNCQSELGTLFLMKKQGLWSTADFKNLESRYWSATTALQTNPKTGSRYSFNMTDGYQSLVVNAGRYGPLFHIWPVHDGDIGSPVSNTLCIDTDGDGWGWDGTQSCRIDSPTSNACDYSNSQTQGGWGWNQTTGQSCPPINQTNNTCIDSDGDGWGWDGASSCKVTTEVSADTCVDTPPFDDNWGWDGQQSCQLNL